MYDLTFSEMMAPYKHAMAVGIAAHGAEIVIKARIAKEHPLLLFNQLPKSAKAEDTLTVVELFEYGRTIQYNELPEALWASTGIRLSGVQQYQEFGRLRNATVHFAAGSDVIAVRLNTVPSNAFLWTCKGTLNSVLEMARLGKPVVVYLAPKKTFQNL